MKTVTFAYRNHRGLTESRTIDVIALDFHCKPGLGYQPGWFLTGYCHDRKAVRSFALYNIVFAEDALQHPSGVFRLVTNDEGYSKYIEGKADEDEGHTSTSY